jgi:hypothetical protein
VSGRSLVQSSPTECVYLNECNREAPIMGGPGPQGLLRDWGKKSPNIQCQMTVIMTNELEGMWKEAVVASC